jgi:hypothetical protein
VLAKTCGTGIFCGVVADEQRDRLHKKTEDAFALSQTETSGTASETRSAVSHPPPGAASGAGAAFRINPLDRNRYLSDNFAGS